ncbi:hypothetical protein [Duganella sp. FT27W]|uniref:hypothetical protein n=1 Tax=Duganella sp. FT27W TaxID=2654636 RepID=UPI00128B050B|nr:hypothetical protein [Duganella sp. FT27W]MPQ56333.1 hypothetical protein [Duganella sp. FT27W]
MTPERFQALKATMPWTNHDIIMGRQTRISVRDRFGNEVPLLDMVDFVKHITAHLARQGEKG